MKMLIGASRGLQNLHSSDIKVIDRDFKSSNILLDKVSLTCMLYRFFFLELILWLKRRSILFSASYSHSYNAKISDFGLATTGPFADKTPVSARIMGTFGCMAPEYIMTGKYSNPIKFFNCKQNHTDEKFLSGHVNVKSDVYGFGVLLLEVLTGLQAIDQRRGGEQQNLVVWMKTRLSDHRKLIHTNSRSTMIGTTRGIHAVQVPVIYRDFKASNIILDEVSCSITGFN